MNQDVISPESCAAIYGGSASAVDENTSDKPAAQGSEAESAGGNTCDKPAAQGSAGGNTSDKPAAQALTTCDKPAAQGSEAGGEGATGAGDAAGPKGEARPVERLVEEAEQRGYLRGRNEALAGLYASPAVWEEPDSNVSEPMLRPSPADSFLTGRRKGVWE